MSAAALSERETMGTIRQSTTRRPGRGHGLKPATPAFEIASGDRFDSEEEAEFMALMTGGDRAASVQH